MAFKTAKPKENLMGSRVLGHGCFDSLLIYLVLIPVSCFVVLFSVLFRLQRKVVGLNPSQIVRLELLVFLCHSAPHRNTRELYSKNLRAVGPNNAQLKTKQNRKQDNNSRHRNQSKVNR